MDAKELKIEVFFPLEKDFGHDKIVEWFEDQGLTYRPGSYRWKLFYSQGVRNTEWENIQRVWTYYL